MKLQITLDVKKHRIRIHKQTLKVINNPDYISILVNPETKTMLICPCGKNSKDSISIAHFTQKHHEIYGTELIEKLILLNPSIDLNASYGLLGEKCNDGNAVLFDISSAFPVDVTSTLN